jgi:diketogulonate reductase-like aldo/keto reductase
MTDGRSQPSVTLAGGGVMPLVGFGTWQLSRSRCYDAVRVALDVGYRLVDTATVYGNEREVGRAVRDSGVAREELFVTTKLPPRNAGRERATIAASLRALGMDFVDLWLIHWPPRVAARVPTWRALLEVRDEGLARAVGVSNYRTAQLDELVAATGETPEVNQIRWSPPLYEAATLAAHRQRGVVLEGYSPFKSGNLRDATLAEIASGHGVTPAQVVLRWHVDHGVVVIPKSSHRERIESNFDVFGFSLSDQELHRIDRLSRA